MAPKNQRISVKDKIKLLEKAREGLYQKTHLIYFSDDEPNNQEYEGYARLGNTYDVERRLDELKKRLLYYDMFNPCFGSLQKVTDEEDENTTPTLDADNMDPLNNYENISRQYAFKWNATIIK